MLTLKRLTSRSFCTRASMFASQQMRQQEMLYLLSLQHYAQMTPKRFHDIYQDSADEMSRGYSSDMAELKKHGGKISQANKVIISAMEAVKFPDFEVNNLDGKTLQLPIHHCQNAAEVDESSVPKASLLCLSFRANSRAMINSWSGPFVDAFSKSKDIHLYQVSFMYSWFLCLKPIKKFLMWTTRNPNRNESKDTLEKADCVLIWRQLLLKKITKDIESSHRVYLSC